MVSGIHGSSDGEEQLQSGSRPQLRRRNVSDGAKERDPVVQRTELRLWRVEDNRSFFKLSDLFFSG